MQTLLSLHTGEDQSSALVFAKKIDNDDKSLLLTSTDILSKSILQSETLLQKAFSGRLVSILKKGKGVSSSYSSLIKVKDNVTSILDKLNSNFSLPLINPISGKEQGLQKWLKVYNETSGAQSNDSRNLQQQVDEEMSRFDSKESEKEQEKKELVARMQADGFTLVTRKTKLEDEDYDRESSTFKKKRKRGDISAGTDFYLGSSSIQRREKAKSLATLRDEFEKDKQRISEMKTKKANGRVFRG